MNIQRMLHVPTIPSYLDNIYFEYVAQVYAKALTYDAVNNPNGLQWLEVMLPFAEPTENGLHGFYKGRDYIVIQPDDSFKAMCYLLPEEPMERVGGNSWQFNMDAIFFMNLEAINKTTAPQGRYQAVLMEEAIKRIEDGVWGFSKQLIQATFVNMQSIFAEIDQVNPKYLKAPFAAFRLSYVIQIGAPCVEPTIPNIEPCFVP